MRASGLVARRRRRFRVPKPSTTLATTGNVLDRQFAAPAPNRRWVTDITFLTTVQGWLYLAVVLDLFSRRVVGWATSDRLGEGLALEALTMSLARRRPRAGPVHHSDRGPQYISEQYSGVLTQHGIVMSLSRPGNCWDNAVAESFFCDAESRARLRDSLAHAHCRGAGAVRLHPSLLQRPAAALVAPAT